jgi:hypothetical protein
MADLRRVISTPPVDLYLLVQILIPFLTMVLPSFISQVLGLPAQALGLVFALLLAGSISAGLSSGLRGRYNKTIALQPGKAELLDSGQAYAADRSRPDVNQTKRGETRGKGQGEARGRDQGGDSRRVRYSGTKGAYLHGLLSGLLLIAIALPGKALPWPLGALLLVGLGYCLGSLYLYSVEAVQLAALPGRGGRGHGMLESLSSIVTPASYFIGAAVLGSAALGGGRVSASVWVVGLAVILAGYALLIPLFRRRPDTP